MKDTSFRVQGARRRQAARMGGAAIIACALGLSSGCTSLVPHTPDEGKIEKIGIEPARSLMAQTLTGAAEPHISSVQVNDDYLQYFWDYTVPGPYLNPVPVNNVTQIFFANLSKIDIYDSNYVFIWTNYGNHVDKVRFFTLEEAKNFVDLFMSFRARKEKRSPAAPPR